MSNPISTPLLAIDPPVASNTPQRLVAVVVFAVGVFLCSSVSSVPWPDVFVDPQSGTGDTIKQPSVNGVFAATVPADDVKQNSLKDMHYAFTGSRATWYPAGENCPLPAQLPYYGEALQALVKTCLCAYVFSVDLRTGWTIATPIDKALTWGVGVYQIAMVPISLGLLVTKISHHLDSFTSMWALYACFGTMLTTGPWLISMLTLVIQAWMTLHLIGWAKGWVDGAEFEGSSEVRGKVVAGQITLDITCAYWMFPGLVLRIGSEGSSTSEICRVKDTDNAHSLTLMDKLKYNHDPDEELSTCTTEGELWLNGKGRLSEIKLKFLDTAARVLGVLFGIPFVPYILSHVLPGTIVFFPIVVPVFLVGVGMSWYLGAFTKKKTIESDKLEEELEGSMKGGLFAAQQKNIWAFEARQSQYSSDDEASNNEYRKAALASAEVGAEISQEKADVQTRTAGSFQWALMSFVPALIGIKIAMEIAFCAMQNWYAGIHWLESVEVVLQERQIGVYFGSVYANVITKAWAMSQLMSDFF